MYRGENMTPRDISFERRYIESAPEDIQRWFDLFKEKQNNCFKMLNENLYILITLGEKASGGYQVEIKKIEKVDNLYNISYLIEYPKDEQANITSFVYPYDLVVISQDDMNDFEKNKINEDIIKFDLIK